MAKNTRVFQSHTIHEDEGVEIFDADTPTTATENNQRKEENKQMNTKPNLEESTIIIPPKKNKRSIRIALTILLCLVMLAAGYAIGSSSIVRSKQPTNTPPSNAPVVESQNHATLEQLFSGIPVSVVIDNQQDAIPQRGLEKATILWEALAEGDITRYLAVFTDEIPEILGPVRSARTYFNTLANQYGGLFLHVGGNDMALEEIKKDGFLFTDVNEFYNGSTFYRDKKRKAPHNVFTTKQQLEQFIKSKQTPTSTIVLFPTSDITPMGATTISVTIPYSQSSSETIEWSGTAWIKKQNGRVLKDEIGTPIPFDTVLLLSAQDETGFHSNIPELRRYLFSLGGESLVLRDGISLNGTWRFSNKLMTLADIQGNPLGVKPGRTLAIIIPKTIYSKILTLKP